MLELPALLPVALGFLSAMWGFGLLGEADSTSQIVEQLDLSPRGRVVAGGLLLGAGVAVVTGLFAALLIATIAAAILLGGGAWACWRLTRRRSRLAATAAVVALTAGYVMVAYAVAFADAVLAA